MEVYVRVEDARLCIDAKRVQILMPWTAGFLGSETATIWGRCTLHVHVLVQAMSLAVRIYRASRKYFSGSCLSDHWFRSRCLDGFLIHGFNFINNRWGAPIRLTRVTKWIERQWREPGDDDETPEGDACWSG